jgi:hypothetical protein
MTPQQRKEAIRHLKAFDFSGLFTDPSIGWDWPDSGRPLRVPFGDDFIALDHVAEKKGVRILHVPPLKNGSIMPSDDRKKLEKAVTPLATEHLLIFTDKAKTRQIWLWTSRLPGKPVRHRELTWEKDRANELLLQKLTTIAFTLDEEEGLDITGVVQRLRDNLDRDRLTRRFYDDFKRHKDQFQTFIKGIGDSGILAHYTSLMLNRLMFCYFLQQKGFLNGEQDYLRKRLETVPATLGKNKFHSFYRTFLKRLFFDGLDSEARPQELIDLIGKNIPYLNGGIFAEHPIERAHPGIEIPDKAFEKIFDFFDAWQWHLDDRPLGNDREINPEVLGYVFEKYTNQKEMGAYYTKEDITEYISKNTILPFLLQKVAAKLTSEAWDLLKKDPDRYIYQAVRHGAGPDEKTWQKSLPGNIAIGLDTRSVGVSPTSKNTHVGGTPTLLERRKDWNTPAPASHALPTEIWRETIARHQRCHELRKKLSAGEVKEPADLVTLNLDIRQFIQDIISSAPADLALVLWKALRALSVLDPTCGSGAFLFAALEILEPLYEGLLERFRTLLADWQAAGEKHPVWEKEFRQILDAVARHPNEAYFIHKTIIVHNLYGVDIMEEAVEICKLRLFLKLAAQLEPGQTIEPLPDIDFNVRAGNTLVGYASKEEIRKAFTEARGGRGGEQMALLGIENSLDDFRRIMEQAEDADRAFRRFQDLQDTIGQSAADFRTTKDDLEKRLKTLRDQLDRFLAGQYGQAHTKSDVSFECWRASHEPFHWFVEFYGIINSGGFDVIVGNPPYVEYAKVREDYQVGNLKTISSGNLYGMVCEISTQLIRRNGFLGLIVPMSLVSTARMESVRSVLIDQSSRMWLSHYSGNRNPSVLFEGVEMRLTIALLNSNEKPAEGHVSYSTDFRRWPAPARGNLFATTAYTLVPNSLREAQGFPKLGGLIDVLALQKIRSAASGKTIGLFLTKSGSHNIYAHRIASYFIKALDFVPHFSNERDGQKRSEDYKVFPFRTRIEACVGSSIINSSLFYFYFIVFSDAYHCGRDLIESFPADIRKVADDLGDNLLTVEEMLMADLRKNSVVRRIAYKNTGMVEMQKFFPKLSKPLIDQIDTLLATHYGFTEEELDFIINYDIKYRMGLGGGGDAEEEPEA